MNDSAINPSYYKTRCPVECIEVAEHFDFCLGNAIKYIWRAGLKTEDPVTDLEKAIWYIHREIEKVKNENSRKPDH